MSNDRDYLISENRKLNMLNNAKDKAIDKLQKENTELKEKLIEDKELKDEVIILTLKFKLRVDENDELNLLLSDTRKQCYMNIDLKEEITNISKN